MGSVLVVQIIVCNARMGNVPAVSMGTMWRAANVVNVHNGVYFALYQSTARNVHRGTHQWMVNVLNVW